MNPRRASAVAARADSETAGNVSEMRSRICWRTFATASTEDTESFSPELLWGLAGVNLNAWIEKFLLNTF